MPMPEHQIILRILKQDVPRMHRVMADLRGASEVAPSDAAIHRYIYTQGIMAMEARRDVRVLSQVIVEAVRDHTAEMLAGGAHLDAEAAGITAKMLDVRAVQPTAHDTAAHDTAADAAPTEDVLHQLLHPPV